MKVGIDFGIDNFAICVTNEGNSFIIVEIPWGFKSPFETNILELIQK